MRFTTWRDRDDFFLNFWLERFTMIRPMPWVSHELKPMPGLTDPDVPLWKRTGPDALREKIRLHVPEGHTDVVQCNVSERDMSTLSNPNDSNDEFGPMMLNLQLRQIGEQERPGAKFINYAYPQPPLRPVGGDIEPYVNHIDSQITPGFVGGGLSSWYDAYDKDLPEHEGRTWMTADHIARVENTALMLRRFHQRWSTICLHHNWSVSRFRRVDHDELWDDTILPALMLNLQAQRGQIREHGDVGNPPFHGISIWGLMVRVDYYAFNVDSKDQFRENTHEEWERAGISMDDKPEMLKYERRRVIDTLTWLTNRYRKFKRDTGYRDHDDNPPGEQLMGMKVNRDAIGHAGGPASLFGVDERV